MKNIQLLYKQDKSIGLKNSDQLCLVTDPDTSRINLAEFSSLKIDYGNYLKFSQFFIKGYWESSNSISQITIKLDNPTLIKNILIQWRLIQEKFSIDILTIEDD